MNKQIAVLLTCHNRRDKTRTCLQSLFQCTLPETYSLDVYMVDDGSTDGTGEIVRREFPAVNVIQGNGNLFWNRGMHLAWETAAKTKDHDFYLWLNDDTTLFRDAIQNMLEASAKTNMQSIIIGTTISETTQELTYGGHEVVREVIVPNGALQQCKFFNGNIVLIPRHVYSIVGNLDNKFHHALGDYDYGLRARKKGILNLVAPEVCGFCEAHESLPAWCLPEVPIRKRLKVLYTPLANSQPKYFFIYEKRHYGLIVAIKHYLSIHLRVLFPRLWKHQI